MIQSKTKLYIAIGVLMGILVGFVFGAAFGNPDASFKTNGVGKGDISEIAKFRMLQNSQITDYLVEEDEPEAKDTTTMEFTATDQNGETWNIIISK